jgi:hypothetical protein
LKFLIEKGNENQFFQHSNKYIKSTQVNDDLYNFLRYIFDPTLEMFSLIFLLLIVQVRGAKIRQDQVIFSSNIKYANTTASLGRFKNNDTYFNTTMETFEDLARMTVT